LSVVAPTVPVLVPPEAVKTTVVSPPEVRLLPAASLACSVSVTALPDTTVPADTLTTDVAVAAGPGVTWTVGSAVVTATPPIVAPIVFALPARTPVKLAVYVPFALSVVAPTVPVLVPPEAEITTVAPPALRLLPAASLACSVSVTALPDATVPLDTLTTDPVAAVEIAPTVTVTVGSVVVTATPPIVAPTVLGVPARTPVKLAVYVPFALSVVAPIVPVLVPPAAVNTTVDPPVLRSLPAASVACSVSVTALPDTTVGADTLTADRVVEIGPTVTWTVGSVVVTATPPIVAAMVVAVPATIPVKLAVYVPFPLSVVAPTVPVLVPPEAVNATVRPPVVRLFPTRSFACSVSVTALPDATVPADVLTTD
jgi:hypothetical protein